MADAIARILIILFVIGSCYTVARCVGEKYGPPRPNYEQFEKEYLNEHER